MTENSYIWLPNHGFRKRTTVTGVWCVRPSDNEARGSTWAGWAVVRPQAPSRWFVCGGAGEGLRGSPGHVEDNWEVKQSAFQTVGEDECQATSPPLPLCPPPWAGWLRSRTRSLQLKWEKNQESFHYFFSLHGAGRPSRWDGFQWQHWQ